MPESNPEHLIATVFGGHPKLLKEALLNRRLLHAAYNGAPERKWLLVDDQSFPKPPLELLGEVLQVNLPARPDLARFVQGIEASFLRVSEFIVCSLHLMQEFSGHKWVLYVDTDAYLMDCVTACPIKATAASGAVVGAVSGPGALSLEARLAKPFREQMCNTGYEPPDELFLDDGSMIMIPTGFEVISLEWMRADRQAGFLAWVRKTGVMLQLALPRSAIITAMLALDGKLNSIFEFTGCHILHGDWEIYDS